MTSVVILITVVVAAITVVVVAVGMGVNLVTMMLISVTVVVAAITAMVKRKIMRMKANVGVLSALLVLVMLGGCEEPQSALNRQLGEAVLTSDTESALELIKDGASPNVTAGGPIGSATDVPVLAAALSNGMRPVASALIAAGADLNALDSEGTPVISYVVLHGDKQLTLLKAALAKKPSLNVPTVPPSALTPARSPLIVAVEAGNLPATRLLLAAGANPNFAVASRTPLLLAARNLDLPSVQLLVSKGATTTLAEVAKLESERRIPPETQKRMDAGLIVVPSATEKAKGDANFRVLVALLRKSAAAKAN